MGITAIALDIDGVLENNRAHLQMCYYEQRHRLDSQKADEAFIREFERRGVSFFDLKRSQGPSGRYNLGSYILNHQRRALQQLVSKHDAVVVGVSSWFGSSDTKDVRIGEFLGIPLHSCIQNTGGGITRVVGLVEHLKVHPIDNLVILDDQLEGYAKLGFSPVHVSPTKGMSKADWRHADAILSNRRYQGTKHYGYHVY